MNHFIGILLQVLLAYRLGGEFQGPFENRVLLSDTSVTVSDTFFVHVSFAVAETIDEIAMILQYDTVFLSKNGYSCNCIILDTTIFEYGIGMPPIQPHGFFVIGPIRSRQGRIPPGFYDQGVRLRLFSNDSTGITYVTAMDTDAVFYMKADTPITVPLDPAVISILPLSVGEFENGLVNIADRGCLLLRKGEKLKINLPARLNSVAGIHLYDFTGNTVVLDLPSGLYFLHEKGRKRKILVIGH